jgi:hypothetical protein
MKKRSSSSSSAYFRAPPVPSGVGLLDVGERDPVVAAVAEHRTHAVGEEATGEDRLIDAVPTQPLEHVGHERPAGERHHRLGNPGGERPQPGPLPTDEDQCLHYRPIPS